jgi:hypothetical protein
MRVRMNVPHLFKTAGSILVTVSTVIGKGVYDGAGPARSDIERTFVNTLSIGFSRLPKIQPGRRFRIFMTDSG